MDDLISKLSEIRSEYNCFDEDGEPQYRALSEAIRILSQLADGDTISRKAAIDVLARMMPRSYTPDGSHPADEEIFRAQEVFADCIEALEILPSAQSEHTCVNCGRTVNNGGWYADGRTKCPIEEHYALPKDGYCHLWEKRNPERWEA